jgi:hypothetical protein
VLDYKKILAEQCRLEEILLKSRMRVFLFQQTIRRSFDEKTEQLWVVRAQLAMFDPPFNMISASWHNLPSALLDSANTGSPYFQAAVGSKIDALR